MKKTKFLLRLTVLTGIIIILGTAGASDLGRAGLTECASQILLGCGLILLGKAGLNILKAAQAFRKKQVRLKKQKTMALRQANAA